MSHFNTILGKEFNLLNSKVTELNWAKFTIPLQLLETFGQFLLTDLAKVGLNWTGAPNLVSTVGLQIFLSYNRDQQNY